MTLQLIYCCVKFSTWNNWISWWISCWLLKKLISFGTLSDFVWVLVHYIDIQLTSRRVLNDIFRSNLATCCACFKPEPRFPTPHVMMVFCVFKWFEREANSRLIDIDGRIRYVVHPCLNFHKCEKEYIILKGINCVFKQ